MEKPERKVSKRDVITPVNKFVQDQKKLITALKDDLKKDINQIATNIKEKYVKPRKTKTPEEKAAAAEKRKTKAKPKATTAEFGTQTEPKPKEKVKAPEFKPPMPSSAFIPKFGLPTIIKK